jgi:hypothetical protein
MHNYYKTEDSYYLLQTLVKGKNTIQPSKPCSAINGIQNRRYDKADLLNSTLYKDCYSSKWIISYPITDKSYNRKEESSKKSAKDPWS